MATSNGKKIKAYLLLEGLIAMGLLLTLTSLLLSGLTQSRGQEAELNQDIEALNLAQYLLESEQESIKEKGLQVELARTDQGLQIKGQGRLILNVEEKDKGL
ncbi:competence type IV pilus minor pilin ComGE [Lactococcus termiticola]|uniref:Type II secretion protein n=1 Tax=Lactococcus termiticola TaxID=2169526 RepID=A0A2R5HJ40_9LACT|nr:competence type IV pilus minor pilin ComGE [Lactococcus termiticola]GBG96498.1 type II secretion protein [Lactococcus termiticola]